MNCPHCHKSLQGEPIPEEDQPYFNATHFELQIGIEHPELYDGVWEWMCPFCQGKWDSEVKKIFAIKIEVEDDV